MSDLTSLRAERRAIKHELITFQNYISQIKQKQANNEEINLRSLQGRLLEFKPTKAKYINLTFKIAGLDEQEDAEKNCNAYEESFYDLVEFSEELLVAPPPAQSASGGDLAGDVKMPKLKIPEFSGSFESWLNFKSNFISLVHENKSLNKLQKHRYLVSFITGDAARNLIGIETTGENYDEAWDILMDRYDSIVKNVQSHIRGFLDTKTVTSESGPNLRNLLETFSIHIRTLKAMKRPVDAWNDILVVLLMQKLDPATLSEWKREINKNQLPSFKELTEFISKKCDSLETNHVPNKRVNSLHIQINNCVVCRKAHNLYQCDEFNKLTSEEKYSLVKKHKLCTNCLNGNHFSYNCRSRGCKICNKKHNTLLHVNRQIDSNPGPSTSVNISTSNVNETLLSSAIVDIQDNLGKIHQARALLDPGSQSNLISRSLCNKLKLKKENISVTLSGTDGKITTTNEKTEIHIMSKYHKFDLQINAFVVRQVADRLPRVSFNKNSLNIPKNIKLADPNFNITNNFDLLLGADAFWSCLLIGQIKLGKGLPYLQKTRFGWVFGGGSPEEIYSSCNVNIISDQSFNLERFWALEEVPNKSIIRSPSDIQCENHFVKTVTRDETGRFTISLPFIEGNSGLGESKSVALKRFYNLENKLAKNPIFHEQYTSFMHEYLKLGHMEESILKLNEPHYFLPHHAVIKESSLTTKLRVVFDASAKTSNGNSLNDILMTGPVLQDDLCSVLIRFRMHRYVLNADIVKMYRQVKVDNQSQEFQKIFWRDNPNDEIKIYNLKTITYGTSPASYLAVRTLHLLAEIHANKYPNASTVIKRDFYMDDLLTGCNDLHELKILRDHIILILRDGQFNLNKFNCNNEDILKGLNSGSEDILFLDREVESSILGIKWCSKSDIFAFNVSEINQTRITKRTILSEIARLFDPLGLINPVIVTAKLIMQELWKEGTNWDESVSHLLHTKWVEYREQLPILKQIVIKRLVGKQTPTDIVELHGFADASSKAYGACIYIKCINNQTCTVNLICAKSRVAPLKTISLPRLELCAAQLLSELASKLLQNFESISFKFDKVFYWSDSTITLSWIKSQSGQFKTFVANRITDIQNLSDPKAWNHVRTNENPADLLSRGLMPKDIINNEFWWHGPDWLRQNNINYTQRSNFVSLKNMPEIKKIYSVNSCITQFNIFNNVSSFTKLIRAAAYFRRFINYLKSKTVINRGPITSSEYKQAEILLIRWVQSEAFGNEIKNITSERPLANNSRILALSPFLDHNDGLLRVGGRLKHSSLNYREKHPILLPSKHPFTKLLISYYHKLNLHSGTQSTLAAIRTRYWPIAAKGIVKNVINKCITCFKVKPTTLAPVMGDLPASRTHVNRPFSTCGVDFCGPFLIKYGPRSKVSTKAYGAIFICFTTRAVHIELVSNLTTEAFIAALRRFVARRGNISHIYSDNAKNFVGAKNELKELYKLVSDNSFQTEMTEFLTPKEMTWHFSPARSPHFGGLWEANIKQVKYNLKRVIGQCKLTFEELYTLLVQIEAILNSRPISPLSNDPNDPSFLSPGHFLIGDTLTSVPDPDLQEVQINKLSRWQHLQKMKQDFWKRWVREYLSSQQVKSKWRQDHQINPEVGQLALIHEDNVPPMRWIVGRIS